MRKDLTLRTKQLASVEMAVDKIHMKGHTDPLCRAKCDSGNFKQLNKVHVLHQRIKSSLHTTNYIFRLTLKCVSKFFPGYQDTLASHKK